MIKVASVYVRRAEGTVSECTETIVPSFKEANAVLRRHARTAPHGGAYDKCDFVVTYEDGEQYEGRFDLKQDHMFGASIEASMERYLKFHTGEQCPGHMTKKRYDAYIEAIVKPENRANYKRFLATYALEDA